MVIDKMQIVIIALIVIVIAILIFLAYRAFDTQEPFDRSNLVQVYSTIDGKRYLVQNLPDRQEAANIMAIVQERINILRNYLANNINYYPSFRLYILQFLNKIGSTILIENPPDGKHTSFTVNKGDVISLCLRQSQTQDLHDINLIMYVVLHELAHVACPEFNHTPLFQRIFTFFIIIAIQLGIYERDNYEQIPRQYCGMTIDENLLD